MVFWAPVIGSLVLIVKTLTRVVTNHILTAGPMLSKNLTFRTAPQGARSAIDNVKGKNRLQVAGEKASGYREARITAYWHGLIVLVPVQSG